MPGFLPDTDDVRDDLAGLHGSITKADSAVGRLLDTVAELGLDDSTWIVFVTDHGLAFPRAKSTLYAEGTGIALIMRPPSRLGITPTVYDDLFSGVDLTPTLLDLVGVDIPDTVDGDSHAPALVGTESTAVRTEVFTEKTYHDAFDPIRAVRTKDFSYIENYAARPALLLPLDIADSLSARSLDRQEVQQDRSRVELYDLRSDPHERNNLADDPSYAHVRDELARALADWRERTHDDLPDEAAGTATAEAFMDAFHAKAAQVEAEEEALPSRRPLGARRELAGDITSGER